jgi:hypothetical protein
MKGECLIPVVGVLLLGAVATPVRAQHLTEPRVPVCMVDGFGNVWDLVASGGGGTFSLSGTVALTSGNTESASGTYDRTANALTLTASGGTICDFTYTGSCEPAPGPPLGYCSGSWTNKCGASGTWLGTVTRGACEADLAPPVRSEAHPAAAQRAVAAQPGRTIGAAALGRNHPNPFTRATTITYTLPEAVHVRLTVYDVLGREVAVLVDEPREAGTHAAVFEVRSLPAGAYVYRMEAGSFAEARRMMVAR